MTNSLWLAKIQSSVHLRLLPVSQTLAVKIGLDILWAKLFSANPSQWFVSHVVKFVSPSVGGGME